MRIEAWARLSRGKGVGHAGVHFYRITATLHVFDDAAIRRADGFERALGSPVLAHVLGPDEPLSAAAHTKTEATAKAIRR